MMPSADMSQTMDRILNTAADNLRVAKILVSGEPRVRGLPPTPKDIAVLALRNGMLEATAYSLARAGIPYVAASDAMLTIDPPPALRMAGTTALQQFQMPLTLTVIAASQSASVTMTSVHGADISRRWCSGMALPI